MRVRSDKPPPHRGQSLNLDEFLRAAAYAVEVVPRHELTQHIAKAEADNSEATALVRRVARWLEQIERGAALRCLGCDRRLRSDDDVEAFAVITEFADPSRGMVSGICYRCVERTGDLLGLVLKQAAKIWDRVHVVDAGRS
jgi:hypothetical protein